MAVSGARGIISGQNNENEPGSEYSASGVSTILNGYLFNHFRYSDCHLFAAPFDVRLYDREKSKLANGDIFTVVQPDLCVVCDSIKLADGQSCNGAPDLVVEILSPSNTKKEKKDKFQLYEEASVREYWLVELSDDSVIIYVLNEAEHYIGLPPATEVAQSAIFPKLSVDLAEVFR